MQTFYDIRMGSYILPFRLYLLIRYRFVHDDLRPEHIMFFKILYSPMGRF